ncbi:hypothetical protein AVDCRST_MAG94-1564 [uncultured Leptolyngbya sp.]|uniref:inorganic diphosphatase n=1 Tax=uncultured Leptolyngbya sp. TaxID=332963 RepID=A0A6J4L5T9_9CYAN|nr:hypothetical protein AVDCRST_MAG94-1564 [uncultured Leptolyngbya sp.]
MQTLADLNQNLVHEIEHFFVSYNDAKGKRFEPQGRFGPDQARQLVQEAAEGFHGERE